MQQKEQQQQVQQQQQQHAADQPYATRSLQKSGRPSCSGRLCDLITRLQQKQQQQQSSSRRRSLLQLAGLANFGVGSYIEAAQRNQAALGAAAAYLNFYGLEGIGLRQPFGALPAPGGLAALAKVGPLGMPGPEGFNAAFIPDQVQGIAETLGPLIGPAAIGSHVLGAAGVGAAGGLGKAAEHIVMCTAEHVVMCTVSTMILCGQQHHLCPFCLARCAVPDSSS
jgi:hypothetical protein